MANDDHKQRGGMGWNMIFFVMSNINIFKSRLHVKDNGGILKKTWLVPRLKRELLRAA
ncbi:hypothetical protein JOD45_000064 [Scopulibacillus daqui]|uniref:Uncharacterized protein n=1 Tax=Scopulibacillus daqui TaxID=1469162 RepID=A0ABS2PUZ1_9BACL|nr:hypothetical protein [Scopulibacillus daqui]MBM7643873.1 hypothetical protein [Scopulibacillus daqui]